jgi:hypothetical protein
MLSKIKPKQNQKNPKIQLAAAKKLDSEQQLWIKPTLLLHQQHEPHKTASNQTAERNNQTQNTYTYPASQQPQDCCFKGLLEAQQENPSCTDTNYRIYHQQTY